MKTTFSFLFLHKTFVRLAAKDSDEIAQCILILKVHKPPVQKLTTVMCLSIGTPKIINFPFVPNGKLTVFRCPTI